MHENSKFPCVAKNLYYFQATFLSENHGGGGGGGNLLLWHVKELSFKTI